MVSRIKAIIHRLANRGVHLASSKLEENRVKYLNVGAFFLTLWFLVVGIIRFLMGYEIWLLIDGIFALACVGVYYFVKFNIKWPRMAFVILAQLAIVLVLISANNSSLFLLQYLKLSIIVLSFVSLLFFDGFQLCLFYGINILLFVSVYLNSSDTDYILIIPEIMLLAAPFFIITGFIRNFKFYEDELKNNAQLKSRFFANISHELRTPLTLILGPLEELKTSEKISNSRNIHLIEKHAKKLLMFVNQILDLSKAQHGFTQLKLNHYNISDHMKGLCSIFTSYIRDKDLHFLIDFPEEDIDGHAEAESLDKIVSNLVYNAVKFSEKGDKIKIVFKVISDTYSWLEIQIIDTGIGIDEGELPSVFERYYHTTGGAEFSTGIGLALVKELTERHGGIIDVKSEIGVGTRFTIRIPIEEQYYQDKGINYSIEEFVSDQYEIINYVCQETAPPDTYDNGNHSTSLLLVEDNEDMRKYIQQMISGSYSLVVAKDGQEGIDIARKEIPDIIIADVMMPKMSGIELAKVLKQDISTSHIPIILLSAKADSESKIEGYKAGADDYILKPFDRNELICRVENLIRIREQLQRKNNDSCIFSISESRQLSTEEKFIKNVTEVIFDNIDNTDFSVEKLAKETGVSRSQLYRKINALTGLSINQFIRRKRLIYAYQLLEQNTGTVSEIAFKSGFSSPNYFSKCFREVYHVSPGEVRKK